MLKDWISAELIQCQVEVLDVEQAIRVAAQPLVNHNKIKQHYVDEILQNLKEVGPYFVLMPRLALPHAQSKDGVLENAISIMTLKNPICFGSKENDPVKYLFTLAATGGADHLTALATLAELFEDADFFNLLDQSHSPQEIMEYINRK